MNIVSILSNYFSIKSLKVRLNQRIKKNQDLLGISNVKIYPQGEWHFNERGEMEQCETTEGISLGIDQIPLLKALKFDVDELKAIIKELEQYEKRYNKLNWFRNYLFGDKKSRQNYCEIIHGYKKALAASKSSFERIRTQFQRDCLGILEIIKEEWGADATDPDGGVSRSVEYGLESTLDFLVKVIIPGPLRRFAHMVRAWFKIDIYEEDIQSHIVRPNATLTQQTNEYFREVIKHESVNYCKKDISKGKLTESAKLQLYCAALHSIWYNDKNEYHNVKAKPLLHIVSEEKLDKALSNFKFLEQQGYSPAKYRVVILSDKASLGCYDEYGDKVRQYCEACGLNETEQGTLKSLPYLPAQVELANAMITFMCTRLSKPDENYREGDREVLNIFTMSLYDWLGGQETLDKMTQENNMNDQVMSKLRETKVFNTKYQLALEAFNDAVERCVPRALQEYRRFELIRTDLIKSCNQFIAKIRGMHKDSAFTAVKTVLDRAINQLEVSLKTSNNDKQADDQNVLSNRQRENFDDVVDISKEIFTIFEAMQEANRIVKQFGLDRYKQSNEGITVTPNDASDKAVVSSDEAGSQAVVSLNDISNWYTVFSNDMNNQAMISSYPIIDSIGNGYLFKSSSVDCIQITVSDFDRITYPRKDTPSARKKVQHRRSSSCSLSNKQDKSKDGLSRQHNSTRIQGQELQQQSGFLKEEGQNLAVSSIRVRSPMSSPTGQRVVVPRRS